MNKSRFLLKILLGSAFLALATMTLAAQNESAEAASTHMLVTVVARHGSEVPDVSRDDVMVYEGNNRDSVTDWVPAQGNNAGLELYILLDDGSNVTLGTQLPQLRQFIAAQPASTKVGVAYMQNGSAKVLQELTSDHTSAANALRLPMGIPGINGSPYFSVSDLIKHWPQTSARREVIMVTDGIDHYYNSRDLDDPYLSAAIDDAQRAGVPIFGIYSPGSSRASHSYWQTYWGQIYLAKLAADTGGQSYYIGFNGPPVSFSPYLDDVGNRLGHQYLLTFVAQPEKKSGFQRVKVTTEVSNANLVSANKVYVTASPR